MLTARGVLYLRGRHFCGYSRVADGDHRLLPDIA
jgi:hypothetical protein